MQGRRDIGQQFTKALGMIEMGFIAIDVMRIRRGMGGESHTKYKGDTTYLLLGEVTELQVLLYEAS